MGFLADLLNGAKDLTSNAIAGADQALGGSGDQANAIQQGIHQVGEVGRGIQEYLPNLAERQTGYKADGELNDPMDVSMFVANLIPGMVGGLTEVPEKIQNLAGGSIVQDDGSRRTLSPEERMAYGLDAGVDIADLFLGKGALKVAKAGGFGMGSVARRMVDSAGAYPMLGRAIKQVATGTADKATGTLAKEAFKAIGKEAGSEAVQEAIQGYAQQVQEGQDTTLSGSPVNLEAVSEETKQAYLENFNQQAGTSYSDFSQMSQEERNQASLDLAMTAEDRMKQIGQAAGLGAAGGVIMPLQFAGINKGLDMTIGHPVANLQNKTKNKVSNALNSIMGKQTNQDLDATGNIVTKEQRELQEALGEQKTKMDFKNIEDEIDNNRTQSYGSIAQDQDVNDNKVFDDISQAMIRKLSENRQPSANFISQFDHTLRSDQVGLSTSALADTLTSVFPDEQQEIRTFKENDDFDGLVAMLKGQPLVFSRAPYESSNSVVSVFPVKAKSTVGSGSNVVRMNQAVAKGLGLDNDGDTLSAIAMTPENMTEDPQENEFLLKNKLGIHGSTTDYGLELWDNQVETIKPLFTQNKKRTKSNQELIDKRKSVLETDIGAIVGDPKFTFKSIGEIKTNEELNTFLQNLYTKYNLTGAQLVDVYEEIRIFANNHMTSIHSDEYLNSYGAGKAIKANNLNTGKSFSDNNQIQQLSTSPKAETVPEMKANTSMGETSGFRGEGSLVQQSHKQETLQDVGSEGQMHNRKLDEKIINSYDSNALFDNTIEETKEKQGSSDKLALTAYGFLQQDGTTLNDLYEKGDIKSDKLYVAYERAAQKVNEDNEAEGLTIRVSTNGMSLGSKFYGVLSHKEITDVFPHLTIREKHMTLNELATMLRSQNPDTRIDTWARISSDNNTTEQKNEFKVLQQVINGFTKDMDNQRDIQAKYFENLDKNYPDSLKLFNDKEINPHTVKAKQNAFAIIPDNVIMMYGKNYSNYPSYWFSNVVNGKENPTLAQNMRRIDKLEAAMFLATVYDENGDPSHIDYEKIDSQILRLLNSMKRSGIQEQQEIASQLELYLFDPNTSTKELNNILNNNIDITQHFYVRQVDSSGKISFEDHEQKVDRKIDLYLDSPSYDNAFLDTTVLSQAGQSTPRVTGDEMTRITTNIKALEDFNKTLDNIRNVEAKHRATLQAVTKDQIVDIAKHIQYLRSSGDVSMDVLRGIVEESIPMASQNLTKGGGSNSKVAFGIFQVSQGLNNKKGSYISAVSRFSSILRTDYDQNFIDYLVYAIDNNKTITISELDGSITEKTPEQMIADFRELNTLQFQNLGTVAYDINKLGKTITSMPTLNTNVFNRKSDTNVFSTTKMLSMLLKNKDTTTLQALSPIVSASSIDIDGNANSIANSFEANLEGYVDLMRFLISVAQQNGSLTKTSIADVGTFIDIVNSQKVMVALNHFSQNYYRNDFMKFSAKAMNQMHEAASRFLKTGSFSLKTSAIQEDVKSVLAKVNGFVHSLTSNIKATGGALDTQGKTIAEFILFGSTATNKPAERAFDMNIFKKYIHEAFSENEAQTYIKELSNLKRVKSKAARDARMEDLHEAVTERILNMIERDFALSVSGGVSSSTSISDKMNLLPKDSIMSFVTEVLDNINNGNLKRIDIAPKDNARMNAFLHNFWSEDTFDKHTQSTSEAILSNFVSSQTPTEVGIAGNIPFEYAGLAQNTMISSKDCGSVGETVDLTTMLSARYDISSPWYNTDPMDAYLGHVTPSGLSYTDSSGANHIIAQPGAVLTKGHSSILTSMANSDTITLDSFTIRTSHTCRAGNSKCAECSNHASGRQPAIGSKYMHEFYAQLSNLAQQNSFKSSKDMSKSKPYTAMPFQTFSQSEIDSIVSQPNGINTLLHNLAVDAIHQIEHSFNEQIETITVPNMVEHYAQTLVFVDKEKSKTGEPLNRKTLAEMLHDNPEFDINNPVDINQYQVLLINPEVMSNLRGQLELYLSKGRTDFSSLEKVMHKYDNIPTAKLRNGDTVEQLTFEELTPDFFDKTKARSIAGTYTGTVGHIRNYSDKFSKRTLDSSRMYAFSMSSQALSDKITEQRSKHKIKINTDEYHKTTSALYNIPICQTVLPLLGTSELLPAQKEIALKVIKDNNASKRPAKTGEILIIDTTTFDQNDFLEFERSDSLFSGIIKKSLEAGALVRIFADSSGQQLIDEISLRAIELAIERAGGKKSVGFTSQDYYHKDSKTIIDQTPARRSIKEETYSSLNDVTIAIVPNLPGIGESQAMISESLANSERFIKFRQDEVSESVAPFIAVGYARVNENTFSSNDERNRAINAYLDSIHNTTLRAEDFDPSTGTLLTRDPATNANRNITQGTPLQLFYSPVFGVTSYRFLYAYKIDSDVLTSEPKKKSEIPSAKVYGIDFQPNSKDMAVRTIIASTETLRDGQKLTLPGMAGKMTVTVVDDKKMPIIPATGERVELVVDEYSELSSRKLYSVDSQNAILSHMNAYGFDFKPAIIESIRSYMGSKDFSFLGIDTSGITSLESFFEMLSAMFGVPSKKNEAISLLRTILTSNNLFGLAKYFDNALTMSSANEKNTVGAFNFYMSHLPTFDRSKNLHSIKMDSAILNGLSRSEIRELLSFSATRDSRDDTSTLIDDNYRTELALGIKGDEREGFVFHNEISLMIPSRFEADRKNYELNIGQQQMNALRAVAGPGRLMNLVGKSSKRLQDFEYKLSLNKERTNAQLNEILNIMQMQPDVDTNQELRAFKTVHLKTQQEIEQDQRLNDFAKSFYRDIDLSNLQSTQRSHITNLYSQLESKGLPTHIISVLLRIGTKSPVSENGQYSSLAYDELTNGLNQMLHNINSDVWVLNDMTNTKGDYGARAVPQTVLSALETMQQDYGYMKDKNLRDEMIVAVTEQFGTINEEMNTALLAKYPDLRHYLPVDYISDMFMSDSILRNAGISKTNIHMLFDNWVSNKNFALDRATESDYNKTRAQRQAYINALKGKIHKAKNVSNKELHKAIQRQLHHQYMSNDLYRTMYALNQGNAMMNPQIWLFNFADRIINDISSTVDFKNSRAPIFKVDSALQARFMANEEWSGILKSLFGFADSAIPGEAKATKMAEAYREFASKGQDLFRRNTKKNKIKFLNFLSLALRQDPVLANATEEQFSRAMGTILSNPEMAMQQYEQTIKWAANRVMGRDLRNETVITYLFDSMLNKMPEGAQFAVRFTNPFFKFTTNFINQHVPGTSTVMYLGTKGFINWKQRTTGERLQYLQQDLNLRTALVKDMMKLGTPMLVGLLLYGLGVYPPDDEDPDKDGFGDDVLWFGDLPLHFNFIIKSLLAPSLGWAKFYNGVANNANPVESLGHVFRGYGDAIGSMPFHETADALQFFYDFAVEPETDEDGKLYNANGSMSWENQMMVTALKKISSLTTPQILKDIYQSTLHDKYSRSKTLYYLDVNGNYTQDRVDPETGKTNKAVRRGSSDEAVHRMTAKDPVLATVFNFLNPDGMHDYFLHDMPIQKMKNPASQELNEFLALQMIARINNGESVEDVWDAQAGRMIPGVLRSGGQPGVGVDYDWWMSYDNKLALTDKLYKQAKDSNTSEAWDNFHAYNDILWDIIPTSQGRLNVLNTTWAEKSNGELVPSGVKNVPFLPVNTFYPGDHSDRTIGNTGYRAVEAERRPVKKREPSESSGKLGGYKSGGSSYKRKPIAYDSGRNYEPEIPYYNDGELGRNTYLNDWNKKNRIINYTIKGSRQAKDQIM
jgi:hypothetical protein